MLPVTYSIATTWLLPDVVTPEVVGVFCVFLVLLAALLWIIVKVFFWH